jgi:hypothetical protein
MHFFDAKVLLSRFVLAQSDSAKKPKVGFVSPAVSVILAAAATGGNYGVNDVAFASDDSLRYAENNGLVDALNNRSQSREAGALLGITYSRLTKLSGHDEVNFCNKVIADLLYGQLCGDENKRFVNRVVKIVGELHDNVASHARGVGFSAAQVYSPNGKPRIEFAIADCGCGMLKNVQLVDAAILSDLDAIEWCLKRGHTTARKPSDWAQRLPPDCAESPFPASVPVFREENHHVGEGLWQLTELVRLSGGNALIWSGNCCLYLDGKGNKKAEFADIEWKGLAIELEFDIEKARSIGTSDGPSLADLAERLGL